MQKAGVVQKRMIMHLPLPFSRGAHGAEMQLPAEAKVKEMSMLLELQRVLPLPHILCQLLPLTKIKQPADMCQAVLH